MLRTLKTLIGSWPTEVLWFACSENSVALVKWRKEGTVCAGLAFDIVGQYEVSGLLIRQLPP